MLIRLLFVVHRLPALIAKVQRDTNRNPVCPDLLEI